MLSVRDAHLITTLPQLIITGDYWLASSGSKPGQVLSSLAHSGVEIPISEVPRVYYNNHTNGCNPSNTPNLTFEFSANWVIDQYVYNGNFPFITDPNLVVCGSQATGYQWGLAIWILVAFTTLHGKLPGSFNVSCLFFPFPTPESPSS